MEPQDWSLFDDRCAARFQAGVEEYRGGDPTRPFSGNPFSCAMEELEDARNYVEEMGLTPRDRDVLIVDLWHLWTRIRRLSEVYSTDG